MKNTEVNTTDKLNAKISRIAINKNGKKLTFVEASLIPFIEKTLQTATKEKPIYSAELATLINDNFDLEHPISESRIRAIINHMRCNSIPVISGAKGYYISYDKEEIRMMYLSLTSRIKSIGAASRGLYDLMVQLNNCEEDDALKSIDDKFFI